MQRPKLLRKLVIPKFSYSRYRAFTLIEVLIVITIIGILMAITAGIYGAAEARSRDQQRLSNLDTIDNALEQYHLDNHAYPQDGLTANNVLVAKYQLEAIEGCAVSGPSGKGYLAPHYLPTVPEDPLHHLVVSGSGSDCNTSPFGQYLYITNAPSSSAAVQAYYLMARLERTSNMSPAGSAAALQAGSFGSSYWGQIIYGPSSTLVFCDQGSSSSQQASCTQNFFKANNPN
ncbi:MAG TPA: prepilin-type N-terminal cleavage/methylation domain-containing protein [Candidatus Saccharimonadales bacterium]|nr:prepilin-type N-terminal cleavage/methylation domain-containing protein [Candidatus Saccharimonadales bacterium]